MLNPNIYKSQAEYWKNLPIIDRSIKACVHLEDEEDIFFWDTILQKCDAGKYLYIPYSKSKEGHDTHGCEQCLKFLPFFQIHSLFVLIAIIGIYFSNLTSTQSTMSYKHTLIPGRTTSVKKVHWRLTASLLALYQTLISPFFSLSYLISYTNPYSFCSTQSSMMTKR